MGTGLIEGVQRLRDTVTELLDADLTHPTDPEFLTALIDLETVARQLNTAMSTRMIIEAATRPITAVAGFNATHKFLTGFLRLSGAEARRRVRDALDFGERTGLSGEPIPSRHPHVTAAQRDGAIGVEHTHSIRETLRKIPHAVPAVAREAAEAVLTNTARTAAPEDVTEVGRAVLGHLDPDGKLSDDTDRQRRRGLRLTRQGTDLMSGLTGTLDPHTRAMLDVILAKWAKPGMNNPEDDDSPRGAVDDSGVDALRVEAAAGRDRRTQEQRNHDALKALLEWILAAGELGEHNGLPMHLIVTMTLTQLEQETGLATTATGGIIPVKDALESAKRCHRYLCLLDVAGRPLHFARQRRTASLDQRLALFAAEGGCTGPHCPVPAMGSQVHHRDRDFQHGANTDIEELTLACAGHHRGLDDNDGEHIPDGWHTRSGKEGTDHAGRTLWIPPASLDPERKPVVNDRHRPQRLLDAAIDRIYERWAAEWGQWEFRRTHTRTRYTSEHPDADADAGDP